MRPLEASRAFWHAGSLTGGRAGGRYLYYVGLAGRVTRCEWWFFKGRYLPKTNTWSLCVSVRSLLRFWSRISCILKRISNPIKEILCLLCLIQGFAASNERCDTICHYLFHGNNSHLFCNILSVFDCNSLIVLRHFYYIYLRLLKSPWPVHQKKEINLFIFSSRIFKFSFCWFDPRVYITKICVIKKRGGKIGPRFGGCTFLHSISPVQRWVTL